MELGMSLRNDGDKVFTHLTPEFSNLFVTVPTVSMTPDLGFGCSYG